MPCVLAKFPNSLHFPSQGIFFCQFASFLCAEGTLRAETLLMLRESTCRVPPIGDPESSRLSTRWLRRAVWGVGCWRSVGSSGTLVTGMCDGFRTRRCPLGSGEAEAGRASQTRCGCSASPGGRKAPRLLG